MEKKIKEFLEIENIDSNTLSFEHNCLSVSEGCQLSDIIKLRDFLGYKDLIIQSGGSCVFRGIKKSNRDLFNEADILLQDEIEPGYTHPFEQWLINNFDDDLLRARWLKSYYEIQFDTNIKRSIILVLGRLSKNNFKETLELLSTALNNENLGIREAAIRSVEHLGCYQLLETYNESNKLLAEYARGVIIDYKSKKL